MIINGVELEDLDTFKDNGALKTATLGSSWTIK